ncbi:MAG: hypothetical protein IJV73_01310 [Clostridia bacterium]|nr:hypothetical protein [Clostridia bacterium]
MMKRRIWKLLCCFLLMLSILPLGILTSSAEHPKKEFVFAMSHCPGLDADFSSEALPCAATYTTVLSADTEELRDLMLYPGGMPFGVKFYTDGVMVVGFCDIDTGKGSVNPAARAGLHQKDVILKINGEVLSGAADMTERIEASGGKPLQLTCRRSGKEFETTLTPVLSAAEGRYKTGIWVRDSGAGIGTVTFLFPDSGAFAGLGHGICDADTGALVQMRKGAVSDVTISSVVKGAAGAPGELKGHFNPGRSGALLGNSACGVWGVFSEVPETACEPMPIGLRDDLCEGDAYILCTATSGEIQKYDIRISNIKRDAKGSKCFTVTVTDPDLLALTG